LQAAVQQMAAAAQRLHSTQERALQLSPGVDLEGDAPISPSGSSSGSAASQQFVNDLEEDARMATLDEGATADDEASHFVPGSSSHLMVRPLAEQIKCVLLKGCKATVWAARPLIYACSQSLSHRT
jgi:hypothetical protein